METWSSHASMVSLFLCSYIVHTGFRCLGNVGVKYRRTCGKRAAAVLSDGQEACGSLK